VANSTAQAVMLTELADAQHQATKHQGYNRHKDQAQEQLTKGFEYGLGQGMHECIGVQSVQDRA